MGCYSERVAMKISLVEYDAGNLPSVERALARQGVASERVATPEAVRAADALILPGVGHFGQLMRTLGARGLLAPLAEAISRGTPLLGICLGLQALFSGSAEAPGDPGLGLFPGEVAALPATAKLPHMGWNQVHRKRESVLLEGVPASAYFYFAHSYAALENDNDDGDAGDAVVAICDHGAPFVAVLERANVLAVQFHPEKSAEAGARVLGNFVAYATVRQTKARSRA
jgi:glutamine amidotransferase